jgi:hypothetical protein
MSSEARRGQVGPFRGAHSPPVPIGDEEGLQNDPAGAAGHASDTPLTSYPV